MIGFSIMMWFVSIILFCVSLSLLRGNVSVVHGKVFDTTNDKVGYAKALGKPVLLMAIGMVICGVIALLETVGDIAIVYALAVLVIVVSVAVIWFIKIQKRYRNDFK